MSQSSAVPPFFFHLLADRRGKPRALLIDVDGAGCAPALREQVGEPAFVALGQRITGLFHADIDGALAAALEQAGWKPMAPQSLYRAGDANFAAALPAAALWIGGDWCLAPPPQQPAGQSASRALALQLVQLVAADADNHEIEALLRRDPTLSYNLLRLVNSLGVGVMGRRITSFSQAIMILGRQQLRRWLNLMLFSARAGDARSVMLLARVTMRARTLELLARIGGLDKATQEQSFMAGMFSLIGALFGMPLAEVLAPLALSPALSGALLRREGELGAMLALVETAERGDMAALAQMLEQMQLSATEFNDVMVEAADWMLDTLRDNQAGGHA
ncbi:MAG: HDOD domain-containing protein [Pseudomonadota bacterium]